MKVFEIFDTKHFFNYWMSLVIGKGANIPKYSLTKSRDLDHWTITNLTFILLGTMHACIENSD